MYKNYYKSMIGPRKIYSSSTVELHMFCSKFVVGLHEIYFIYTGSSGKIYTNYESRYSYIPLYYSHHKPEPRSILGVY